MKIRPTAKKDHDAIVRLGNKLGHTPDGHGWFTEDAHRLHIPFDARVHRGFVAEEGTVIVGFITYTSYDTKPMTPYISWIGVDPDFHRKGIGSKLIARVGKEILAAGVKSLYVETPTREEGIGSDYEKTYKFYERVGFEVEKVRPHGSPDNICDCDMAVLRKVLG